MKRRTVLTGGAVAAGLAGAIAYKPADLGGDYSPYFAQLNALLRKAGPGHPVMLVDRQRLTENIRLLTQFVAPPKTYRLVVKSLPSMALLEHAMSAAGTQSLMVFHQPFLSAVARQLPDADVLMGKPMPINAVQRFYAGWARDAGKRTHSAQRAPFNPDVQLQWLIDSAERLEQYLQFARSSGTRLQVNFELDVGLHRGGFASPEQTRAALKRVLEHPQQLSFSGFMGYEPHLAGVADRFDHPALQAVLGLYREQVETAASLGVDVSKLTLNGAGSHTLPLYAEDALLNDLSAGSALVKPSDFDSAQLAALQPALFIGAPILKHSPDLQIPGRPGLARALPWWDPNTAQLYFMYGGYWKAQTVSPPGLQDWLYHSTNQSPLMASNSVSIGVDDHVFLRPTQSEHVMLQFGDLRVVENGALVDRWPVFPS